jgi:hypothetical protein
MASCELGPTDIDMVTELGMSSGTGELADV